MLKFLIAVDGSRQSLRGIEVVGRLARASVPVEVLLINVRTASLPYADLAASSVEALKSAQRLAQDHLLNDAESRALGCGLRVGARLCAEGAPAQEIVRAASEHAVDQIVIGAHGTDALGGGPLLPGSVAQRVLGLSKHPVLFVP